MKTIIDTEYMQVQVLEGSRPDIVIFTCTGVGHAMGGVDVQRPEFIKTACRHGTLVTLVDKTRSWGNRVDFFAIREALSGLLEGSSTVLCVGNSMGAFNAVVLSNIVSADVCLAFAPQYSVNPSVVRGEKRWRAYVDCIDTYRFASLQDQFSASIRYCLFNGNHPDEKKHWSRFPASRNIENIVVNNVGHDIARYFKDMGLLESIFSTALSNNITCIELLKSSGVDAVDVNTERLPYRYRLSSRKQAAGRLVRGVLSRRTKSS